MTKFVDVLKESFGVFADEPKFILPKLLIAVLYSVLIILTADLSLQILENPDPELFGGALVLLAATLALALLDIFVGSMYPFMVRDVKKNKPLSLAKAFSEAVAKAPVFMPSLVIVELGFLALTFVLSLPLAFMFVYDEAYVAVFSLFYLVVLVAVVFFFFLLYPIIAFEKVSVVSSLKRSIKASLGNRADVSKATLLSLVLSLFSFGLAFAIEFFPQNQDTVLFWLAFIIVRFLTAYAYSYLFVLTPVFYLDYVGGKK